MIEGQGYRFDQDALSAFADAGARLAGSVDEARGALSAAGELPAGIFGEVGGTSGFVAAYNERAGALGTATEAIGRGMDGLATAVRGYVDDKLRHEDDATTGLRRVGERV